MENASALSELSLRNKSLGEERRGQLWRHGDSYFERFDDIRICLNDIITLGL